MQAHKLSPDTIATASTPPGFDPDSHPIIAAQFFGIGLDLDDAARFRLGRFSLATLHAVGADC